MPLLFGIGQLELGSEGWGIKSVEGCDDLNSRFTACCVASLFCSFI